MKKIFFNFILLGTLLLSTLISAQVVLTALEAPNGFTSTQTRSYSRSFTKNDCTGANYYGTSVIYTQSATATATSTISQADADRLAANAATAEAQRLVNQGGQAYANQYGKCEYREPLYRCYVVDYYDREPDYSIELNMDPTLTLQSCDNGSWSKLGPPIETTKPDDIRVDYPTKRVIETQKCKDRDQKIRNLYIYHYQRVACDFL